MSNTNPFSADTAPSMADILEKLDTIGDLPDRIPGDLKYAVRRFCQLINRRPEEVPAHPNYLRQHLKRIRPARFGISKGSWSNIKSLLSRALHVCGCTVMPGRYTAPLPANWKHLYGLLDNKTLECGLTKFMHFCAAHDIEPDEVQGSTFSLFKEALEQEGLTKDPRIVHQHACRCWNKAAGTIEDWPDFRIEVPSYRETYTLEWPALPSSLMQDTQNWLDRLAGRDLVDPIPFMPVKPSTLKRREFQIRQLASALVHRGRPVASIQTLADLVDVEMAKEALRFFVDRADGKTTSQIGGLAAVIKAIAEYWVKVDEDHLDQLKAIRSNLNPGRGGMTEKTRAVLRQFEDDGVIAEFLELPDKLHRRVRSKTPSFREAVAVQIALVIELLTVAPMRISNLVGLDLDDNVIRIGQGKGKPVHIYIPASDVKNELDLEFPLPNSTVRLLDAYVEYYRPLLIRKPNRWLIPGLGKNHKSRHTVAGQIGDTIEAELGFRITPHQFRHICGYLYLRANPGGYEVVRSLLGHKSIETTIRFYAGMEGIAAAREYASVLAEYKGAQPPGGQTIGENGRDRD